MTGGRYLLLGHRAEHLGQLFGWPRGRCACRLRRLERLQHACKLARPRARSGCSRRRSGGRRCRRSGRNRSGGRRGWERNRIRCEQRRRRRRSRRCARNRSRRSRSGYCLRPFPQRRKQVLFVLRGRARNRAEDSRRARGWAWGRPSAGLVRLGRLRLTETIPERVHPCPYLRENIAFFRNPRLHRLGLTVKGRQPTMQAHSRSARSGLTARAALKPFACAPGSEPLHSSA
jgi:hypothetical protein